MESKDLKLNSEGHMINPTLKYVENHATPRLLSKIWNKSCSKVNGITALFTWFFGYKNMLHQIKMFVYMQVKLGTKV
jgi:hypothetical protein